jgi:hypothetical protein
VAYFKISHIRVQKLREITKSPMKRARNCQIQVAYLQNASFEHCRYTIDNAEKFPSPEREAVGGGGSTCFLA